jgi:hypothetical protein
MKNLNHDFTILDVEPYFYQIPVSDLVLFSLQAKNPFFAALRKGRVMGSEVLIGNHLRPYKTSRKVGVNRSGGINGRFSLAERPGLYLGPCPT